MAEKDNKAAKAALGVSAGAAIVAALAFLKKTASAAPGNGEGGGGAFQIPEEMWNLVIAIAQSGVDIETALGDLAQKLSDLAINVQGYPPNAEGISSYRFECANANQAYQLPDLEVPDGFPLTLLAWNLNPPGSYVLVGRSAAEATNINQGYPLFPGATKDYFIKNASSLFVSAPAVPSYIVVTAERRR
jgi:hypothetical protein